MKTSTDIDSKFRFVILAAKRAKQLLKGAKPKLKSKSKNLIRIAQEEVKKGMVDYEIIQTRPEELHDTENDIFIGEELGVEVESVKEVEAKDEDVKKKKTAKKTTKKTAKKATKKEEKDSEKKTTSKKK